MAESKHVLLIIETSKAYGRGLLTGIGRYSANHGQWTLYVEERALHDRQPSWLGKWQGDGIIFRSYGQAMVDAIRASGLPAVDTNSRISGHGFPLVYAELVRQLDADQYSQREDAMRDVRHIDMNNDDNRNARVARNWR